MQWRCGVHHRMLYFAWICVCSHKMSIQHRLWQHQNEKGPFLCINHKHVSVLHLMRIHYESIRCMIKSFVGYPRLEIIVQSDLQKALSVILTDFSWNKLLAMLLLSPLLSMTLPSLPQLHDTPSPPPPYSLDLGLVIGWDGVALSS